MYCNKCGAKLLEGSNFCHNCGNNLKSVKVIIREAEENKLNQLKLDDFIKNAKPTPKDYSSKGEIVSESNNQKSQEFKLDKKDEIPSFKESVLAFFGSTTKENKLIDTKVNSPNDKEKPVIDFQKNIDSPKKSITGNESIPFSEKIKSYFKNIKETEESSENELGTDYDISSKLSNEIPETTSFHYDETVLPFEKEIKEKVIRASKNKDEVVSKVSDSSTIKTVESEISQLSLLQRFINFMKEDELEDDLILSKFDKKAEVAEIKKDSSSIIDENKIIEAPNTDKTKTAPIDVVNVTEPEPFESDKIAKSKKEKSPSSIDKLWRFINAEDEDNLLDNIEETEESRVSNKAKTEKSLNSLSSMAFFEKLKNFFGIGIKDFDDGEEYDEPENTKVSTKVTKVRIKDSAQTDKHIYTNKDHTITYSKQVIESALKEAEKKEKFPKNLEETQVFSEPLVTDELLKEEIQKENKEQEKKILNLAFDEVSDFTDKTKPEEEIISESKESLFVLISAFFARVLQNIKEFFKSIIKFFTPNSKKDDLIEEEKKKDNLDIILNSPIAKSSDTIPLILSEEEKKILNKELDRRQDSPELNILAKSNKTISPYIRKLINLGAYVRIPILVITLFLTYMTIAWVVKNNFFITLLTFLKFIAIYVTLGTATRASLDSLGVRLKKKAVSFFIIFQMLIYQIIDAIILRNTMINDQNIQAILKVFSPNIYTIGIIVFLAFVMLVISYNKISERNGTLLFLGWYVVIATTITIMIILIDLLFVTVLSTIFLNMMF